jgi:hypothetical protein
MRLGHFNPCKFAGNERQSAFLACFYLTIEAEFVINVEVPKFTIYMILFASKQRTEV